MRHLKLSRWVAALTLALAPGAVSAEDADTLSISGTFRMYSLSRTVGADLAQVYANDYDHSWTLTLHGVTYSDDTYSYLDSYEWQDYLYVAKITRVHATSIDFEFFGPDADVLNGVVSQQLVSGGDDGVILTLQNSYYYTVESESLIGQYGAWNLRLSPLDIGEGVSFYTNNWGISAFSSDEDGYPLIEPKRVRAFYSTILDQRPGNDGLLQSFNDDVNIGSDVPPVLPPSLNIVDGSVPEGNKGTTRSNLTVKLTQSTATPVTVNYATADGTAQRKSDYAAKSGTLTFQPGQTQATIPIAIKGDRKREQDETFSVRLSSAVGATIADGVATATILNDD